MMTTIRPPVKWHGGKHYLAQRIIARIPPHRVYVEPYGGGASVLLNKKPSEVEVYNDLDGRLVNLFKVLRNQGQGSALRSRLTLTPYAEAEFDEARSGSHEGNRTDTPDDVELAREFYVRCRQSLGGRGEAWSYTLTRCRRGMADVVSGYLSAIDEEMPRIIERLRQVQITNRLALDVIHRWDSVDTAFYCDPPYPSEARSTPAVYACEMTEQDHRDLSLLLRSVKGHVLLSGYDCPLYDELYAGWPCERFELPNNAAGGAAKRRMVECLWQSTVQ